MNVEADLLTILIEEKPVSRSRDAPTAWQSRGYRRPLTDIGYWPTRGVAQDAAGVPAPA